MHLFNVRDRVEIARVDLFPHTRVTLVCKLLVLWFSCGLKRIGCTTGWSKFRSIERRHEECEDEGPVGRVLSNARCLCHHNTLCDFKAHFMESWRFFRKDWESSGGVNGKGWMESTITPCDVLSVRPPYWWIGARCVSEKPRCNRVWWAYVGCADGQICFLSITRARESVDMQLVSTFRYSIRLTVKLPKEWISCVQVDPVREKVFAVSSGCIVYLCIRTGEVRLHNKVCSTYT